MFPKQRLRTNSSYINTSIKPLKKQDQYLLETHCLFSTFNMTPVVPGIPIL